jgi:hypothetical protein
MLFSMMSAPFLLDGKLFLTATFDLGLKQA